MSVGGDHSFQGARGTTVGQEPAGSALRRQQPAGHRHAPGVPAAASQPVSRSAVSSSAGSRSPASDSVPRQRGAAGFDDADFRDYVASRSRALLRTAYLLTGNAADAEDLVQSALAKTYQAWGRIQDRGALDGYVRRAMVNTHISWWRRRRVEEFPTDEIPDQPMADPSADTDLHDVLQRAIGRLPQRMRAAVVLRFYQDMSEAEVADVLGISQGTVKSTVSRAMAKLRIDAELRAD